jgi:predicted kinase
MNDDDAPALPRTGRRPNEDAGAWPAVIAMSGLPFAGKSTLARALATAQGRTLLEIDRLIDHDAVPTGEPVPDRAWIVAYREADALLRIELAAGRRVVYDGVNFRWVQREKLRRLAREFGQRVLVVHVSTPIEANLARQRANALHPVRPIVDAGTFAMVRARFEPPRAGEWAVTYSGREPVGTWLARVGAGLEPEGPMGDSTATRLVDGRRS